MLATLFTAALAIGGAAAAAMPTSDNPVFDLAKRADIGDKDTWTLCPIGDRIGPSLLIAVVSPPPINGVTPPKEIGAWSFGNTWCTSYQKFTTGKNWCTGRTSQHMHVPLSNKQGESITSKKLNCYANIYATFSGCGTKEVKATFTNKDDSSNSYTYNCVPDTEHRGCTYDGTSTTDYTSIMACGIIGTD